MRILLLVLVLGLVPQDEARIRDWIRGLEEESAAARDRALESLIQAGEAAEPELRKAVETGSTEVRARAAEALKAIAWKRRYDPAPRNVSLRAEKVPLKTVLADLAKQSGTPIKSEEVEEADADLPVTVRVDDVPLSRALEALCRAHGKIDYSIRCGGDEEPEVVLESAAFADCPRVIDGTIELRLQSVRTELAVDAGGPRKEKTTLAFAWHWEKGTRPMTGLLKIDELRDEKGSSYADRLDPEDEGTYGHEVPTELSRTMPVIPPEGVSRWKVIKGALVVVLPLGVQEFSFDRPGEMIGKTLESRWGNVRLAEFGTGTRTTRLKVETRPQDLVNRLRVAFLDSEGKEFPRIHGELGLMGDYGFRELEFPVDQDRKPAGVLCTAPVGRRERRVPFEFHDVLFR